MWSSQGLEGVLRGPEREEAGIQKGNWKGGLGGSCPTPKQALAWPYVISTDLGIGPHWASHFTTLCLCFYICKMGEQEHTSLDYVRIREIIRIKYLAQGLRV